MDRMTKTAACQLYEIVEMLPSEEKNKIPENIISLIDERKERYIKSDEYISIEDINLTDETKKYLGYIFLNYLANEDEKTEYRNIISENENRYQNNLKEKYNIDKMFSKKESKSAENHEIKAEMIVVENLKWWDKIVAKIKKLFKK